MGNFFYVYRDDMIDKQQLLIHQMLRSNRKRRHSKVLGGSALIFFYRSNFEEIVPGTMPVLINLKMLSIFGGCWALDDCNIHFQRSVSLARLLSQDPVFRSVYPLTSRSLEMTLTLFALGFLLTSER